MDDGRNLGRALERGVVDHGPEGRPRERQRQNDPDLDHIKDCIAWFGAGAEHHPDPEEGDEQREKARHHNRGGRAGLTQRLIAIAANELRLAVDMRKSSRKELIAGDDRRTWADAGRG